MSNRAQLAPPLESSPRWSSGLTEDLPALQSPEPTATTDTGGPDLSRVATNAIIVASAFIVSRLLGMVREIVIAARFGTSANYDAYVAAFRIPDLIFLVVMSGAFGSAFIPVFGAFIGRGDHAKAWRLASGILTYTLVTLGGVAGLVLLLAGPLMRHVVAPGLAPAQLELATNLTRLLLLSPLLLGLSAAFKGMLEAQEWFTLSAYAPVFYNLAIIFGAVALAPSLGVYGLAIGVIVGALLMACVQAAGLFRRGMRIHLSLDPSVEGLRLVAALMAPRILGQAAFQVNFIVMTNFASREGQSRVASLNYAFQLLMLPYGVLALSVSTVIFPMLTRQFDAGRFDAMRTTLARSIAPLVFLTLPAALGLLFFRTSLVQVLFEFGKFDQRSTMLVSEALGYFALALVGLSVIEALTRGFYAMQDTRTPVIASVSTIAVNIVLSAILAPRLGHGGLALSFSLTTTAEMLLLIFALRRKLPHWAREARSSLWRSGIAALVFAPIAWWIGSTLAKVTDPAMGRGIVGYALFAYGAATAAAVYFTLAWVLGSPEILEFARRLPVVGQRVTAILAVRYRA